MTEQNKFEEYIQADYVNVDTAKAHRRGTIKEYRGVQEFTARDGKSFQKPVLIVEVAGRELTYALSKTTARKLADQLGTDPDAWIGHELLFSVQQGATAWVDAVVVD